MKRKLSKRELDAAEAAYAVAASSKAGKAATSREFQAVLKARREQRAAGVPVTAGERRPDVQEFVDNALGRTRPVTIRFDESDLRLAEKQAAAKGLRYQTYIKMLLHEALAVR